MEKTVMKNPEMITIDIKGKQIVIGDVVPKISGTSLTFLGKTHVVDEKKIVIEGLILALDGKKTPCWIFKNCPEQRRSECPAFPDNGYQCMAIMKTLCKGILQDKMIKKLSNCAKCQFVFIGNHSALEKHQMKFDRDGTPIL